VIDLHSHVLPGIDDGPKTVEGSLELARAAAEAGTATLLATPHVNATHPNDAATIAALCERLATRLAAEDIPLELRPGAEIAVTHVSALAPEELARLTLGGGPYLLIEPPYAPIAAGVEAIVLDLLAHGHRVLLAHPERCPGFQRDPAIVERLVGEGVLTSITATSLAGRFGGGVRRFALRLIERGLAHNVASDAHDHVRRPPGIARDLQDAGLAGLSGWLTEEVPAAILAGEEIPPRPQVALAGAGARRWWRRGR
jgi:protein-tyrosine phosphatase